MTTKAVKDKTLNKNDNLGISYGDKRRQEKQEALREFLEGQKYIEAIHRTLDSVILNDELQVIKFKTETRLRLLNKVLPDLKAIEQTTELSGNVKTYSWVDAVGAA